MMPGWAWCLVLGLVLLVGGLWLLYLMMTIDVDSWESRSDL